jgi:hypothetical protein
MKRRNGDIYRVSPRYELVHAAVDCYVEQKFLDIQNIGRASPQCVISDVGEECLIG